jgi:hypothetical protein
MRKLISLIFLLGLSLQVNSQTNFSNFNLKDGVVKYERIYEIENISEEKLIINLNGFLNSNMGLRDLQLNGSSFTGRIDGMMIDWKKYGGKAMTLWNSLHFPLGGFLSIQVKENRYRIIISEITLSSDGGLTYTLNNDATKNSGSIFTTNKTILNGMEIMDKFFFDKFNVVKEIDSDW